MNIFHYNFNYYEFIVFIQSKICPFIFMILIISTANRINFLWLILSSDISTTTRKVCRMVCNDKSVDPETRLKRAEALLELGKIYVTHTSDTSINDSVQDLFKRIGVSAKQLGDSVITALKDKRKPL